MGRYFPEAPNTVLLIKIALRATVLHGKAILAGRGDDHGDTQ